MIILISFIQYIALERLESIYKSSNLVSNLCVHASSEMTQPIAIIFPHEHNLRHALSSASTSPAPASSSQPSQPKQSAVAGSPPAPKNGPDPTSAPLAVLIQQSLARQLILDQCNALARKNGFARMEMLFDVVLTAEDWTPANGMLTAAMKVNRGNVKEAFRESIEVSFFLVTLILLLDLNTDSFSLFFFFFFLCRCVCKNKRESRIVEGYPRSPYRWSEWTDTRFHLCALFFAMNCFRVRTLGTRYVCKIVPISPP
jgi:hypothetical protein